MVEGRSAARQLQFPPAPRRQDDRPLLVIGTAIVVLLLAATGGVWYVATRSGVQIGPADVPSSVPAAAEVVASVPPAEPVARPPSRGRAGMPPSRGRVSEPPSNARGGRQGPQSKSPVAAAPAATLSPPTQATATDDVLLIAVPKAGEGPVFSAKDAGVTPPALLSPRLTTPLQQDSAADDLSTVDVVISDAGHVESVKLASPVRDYREAMMLSAVKAWRFKPASVDGMPVRYQLRIRISVSSVAAGNR